MANGEAIEVLLRVVSTLEQLEVPYFVGGSMASSFHGQPRSTQDVDIIVRLSPAQVRPLVDALNEEFYINENMIHEAIRRQASFNFLHFATMFKVDVFLHKRDALSEFEMERRQPFTLEGEPPRTVMVASAEDMILQKLHWYELGNRVSDRQWSDVLSILKVKRDNLDRNYLDRIAENAGLAEILQEAFDATPKQ